MKLSDKLTEVNDTFTMTRYDNGFMVEVGGRDKKEDWVTSKIVCNSLEEVIALLKEYNTIKLS